MPRATQFKTLNENEMAFGRKFATAALATIGVSAIDINPTPGGRLVNPKSSSTYLPIPCPTVDGRLTFFMSVGGLPYFCDGTPDWLLAIDVVKSEVLMIPWKQLQQEILKVKEKPHAGLWLVEHAGYTSVGIHVEWAQTVGLIKRVISGKIGKHKFGNARAVEMATDDQFVHLHAHSMYSLLDGASTIEGMVEKAALNGQRACALTDHGHMFGCWKFYQTAKAWGIKPLLGCEVYLVDDINTKYQRFQPDGTMRDARFEHHTTVLAMNQTGWANLCRLLTAAYRDHFFYVPRIDHKMLLENSDGLFILSGCFKGPVSWYLSKYEQPADAPLIPPWWRYDPDKAYATAKMYKDKLGDRFGIEVQSNNYGKHMEAMPRVAQLADDLGIKKYVTNDCHAETEEDGVFQSLLSKISGKDDDMSAEKKKFCYYMKGRAEIDPVGILQPQDFTNTCEVAERCNLEFPKGFLFPRYAVAQDEHWASYSAARGDTV